MNGTHHATASTTLAPSSLALRDQLTEYALARTTVIIRYRWRDEFVSTLVGKIHMVQSHHVAVVMSVRSDDRVIPIATIVAVHVEPKTGERTR